MFFGLPDTLPLLVDAAVMGREFVVPEGGSRPKKLKPAPEELRRIAAMRVVENWPT